MTQSAQMELRTGAHYFLEGLSELGIEYVFSNLGTDHVCLIEELARWDAEGRPHPQMVLVPHENVAIHIAKEVLRRAHSVMQSDPQGPVYLTLPREVLAETLASDKVQSFSSERYGAVLAGGIDDARAQAIAAQLLAASNPIAVTSYLGRKAEAVAALEDLALLCGIRVFEFSPSHMNISRTSPCFGGFEPDKANYAASSASFQLITELLNKKTGAKFTHIPYKGANESVTAVMAGDVTMTLADAGPAFVGLQSGRVKALAVTSAARMKDYPTVPTLSELGIDLKVSLWIGLLAPAGTPAEIVKMLQDAVGKVVAMPDVQKKISGMSVTPLSNTSEEFSKIIATEIPLWKQLAIDNNIKVN